MKRPNIIAFQITITRLNNIDLHINISAFKLIIKRPSIIAFQINIIVLTKLNRMDLQIDIITYTIYYG